MDKWSKKKASETCGGQGMGKFIDYSETKRLSRLKNIKSSIGSNMSHNGWQQQQIEKRRKEQLRQRRKAKKKPLGEGIQVDTKVTKADAISKCGLKLKVTQEGSSIDKKAREKSKASPSHGQLPEKEQSTVRLNNRRCDVGKKTDNDIKRKESSIPLLEDRSNVTNSKRTGPSATIRKVVQKQNKTNNGNTSKQRFQVDEGKENSDNSSSKKEELNSNGTGHPVSKRAAAASSKKYFMDIDSLRREHADAIKMLEELNKCEGNRRRSLDSDNSVVSQSYSSVPSYTAMHNQQTYLENNTLTDEFVRDCSKNSDSVDVEVAQADGRTTGESHAISDSFLNMTHLSISLKDDFDDDQSDRCNDDESITHTPTIRESAGLNLSPVKNISPTKSRSFATSFDDFDNEDEYERNTPPHTPLKNRSFTSSCASIEDEDFFGDADIDSCSSDYEDGYSSGTF